MALEPDLGVVLYLNVALELGISVWPLYLSVPGTRVSCSSGAPSRRHVAVASKCSVRFIFVISNRYYTDLVNHSLATVVS